MKEKAKDPFIRELIHEIRSPLTGLSLMLDSLHDRLTDRPDERELIVKALYEVERLEDLLSEYLTGTERYGGFLPGRIDVIMSDILLMTEKLCEKNGISLAKNISETQLRMINAPKLKQVFINIINNAVEAMPNGGQLSVSLKDEDDKTIVSIKDTGAGIPEYDLPKIFDQGFSAKTGGTGIGLYTAKMILDAHGADIKVISDKGTEFKITFPKI